MVSRKDTSAKKQHRRVAFGEGVGSSEFYGFTPRQLYEIEAFKGLAMHECVDKECYGGRN
jgi:hypothetical protein